MAKKSYWQKMFVGTDAAKDACLSWFSPVCDGMTVESAEVLCDIETDREKKVKAIVRDQDGTRRLATRSLGGKNFTISLVAIRVTL